jgi:hypothetical protein
MQRSAGLPRLSAPSQERFLSYAEFLAQQGAAELLALVRRAAEAQLAGVPLQELLSAQQAQHLLARVAAAIAEGAPAGGRGWAQFLLPEEAELRASLAPRVPDNRAVMLGADAVLVDARVVEQLAAEAAAVVGGHEFEEALQVGWVGQGGRCWMRLLTQQVA